MFVVVVVLFVGVVEVVMVLAPDMARDCARQTLQIRSDQCKHNRRTTVAMTRLARAGYRPGGRF